MKATKKHTKQRSQVTEKPSNSTENIKLRAKTEGLKFDKGKRRYDLVDFSLVSIPWSCSSYLDVASLTSEANHEEAFSTAWQYLARDLARDSGFYEPGIGYLSRAFDLFVEVLEKGAEKYDDYNWQRVRPISRFSAASSRHWMRYMFEKSESVIVPVNHDDFGLPHLAHVMACEHFLAWFQKSGSK